MRGERNEPLQLRVHDLGPADGPTDAALVHHDEHHGWTGPFQCRLSLCQEGDPLGGLLGRDGSSLHGAVRQDPRVLRCLQQTRDDADFEQPQLDRPPLVDHVLRKALQQASVPDVAPLALEGISAPGGPEDDVSLA